MRGYIYCTVIVFVATDQCVLWSLDTEKIRTLKNACCYLNIIVSAIKCTLTCSTVAHIIRALYYGSIASAILDVLLKAWQVVNCTVANFSLKGLFFHSVLGVFKLQWLERAIQLTECTLGFTIAHFLHPAILGCNSLYSNMAFVCA